MLFPLLNSVKASKAKCISISDYYNYCNLKRHGSEQLKPIYG